MKNKDIIDQTNEIIDGIASYQCRQIRTLGNQDFEIRLKAMEVAGEIMKAKIKTDDELIPNMEATLSKLTRRAKGEATKWFSKDDDGNNPMDDTQEDTLDRDCKQSTD